MTTNNPFGKFKVQKDSDDEDERVQPTKASGTSQQLFAPQQEQKKKRKVRPEKTEEPEANDDDGFEVVKQKIPRKRPVEQSTEETQEPKKDHHKKKIVAEYHHNKGPNPTKKREFERHSGTGRGREIAKGGAGGKGTWGNNPKNVARNYERNDDDYVFDSAFNPQKRERRERREYHEEKKTKE